MYIGSIPVRASNPRFFMPAHLVSLSAWIMACMVLCYRYRLLPTKRQHRALETILESQRQLYNAALEERLGAYRHGISLSYFDQSRSLTLWRQSDADARSVPVSLQRATLKRLDDAYRGFYRRLESGQKPGFPRFRGRGWFDTFGFRDMCGLTLRKGRIRFQGLPGSLRIHMHRALPDGAVPRRCTFSWARGGWTVGVAVEIASAPARTGSAAIGIDLGLTNLAALSTGETIPSVLSARRHERRLRAAQRALARKKRGSRGHVRCREELKDVHWDIRQERSNQLHQISARLVRDNDLIAVEHLNVKALANSALRKAVRDASWGTFISMLRYKAERAGTRLVEVSCHDTSQLCSGCGARVAKELRTRWHHCERCGLILDRDVNAARNILYRAGVGPDLLNVVG